MEKTPFFFKKSRIERILIVKTSSIGDILQAFSVLPFLRKRFPQAKIYWAVEARWKSLIENHPFLQEAVCVDRNRKFFSYKNIRKRPYDLLFDLQGNTKSALVTFLARSRYKVGFSKESVKEFPNLFATQLRYSVPLGENIRDQYLHLVYSFCREKQSTYQECPSFFEREEDKALVQKVFAEIPKEKKVLFIAPWSKWENKELSFSFLQAWLEKIERVYAPFFLFVWGEEKEKNKTEKLQKIFLTSSLVIEKTSFFSLRLLIQKCSGVIASDSSLLHLTALTSTPSFSFFGPTSQKVFSPLGKVDQGIQGSCPYQVHFIKQCPFLRSCSTGRCLKDLSIGELFKSFSIWYSFILNNARN